MRYVFPGTQYTTETLTLYWYDGSKRPPAEIKPLIGERPLVGPGLDLHRHRGRALFALHRRPCPAAREKFKEYKLPSPGGTDHYLQFVEACRGNGKTSAPFDYSGPLTESVLLGCLATRFPRRPWSGTPTA